MKIDIIERTRKFSVNKACVKRITSRLYDYFKIPATYEISFYFTGAGHIQTLNSEFRGKDAPTDVLSFPMNEEGELARVGNISSNVPMPLGDIVVCPGYVLENNVGGDWEKLSYEVFYLIVHGFMHLIGYDHKDGRYKGSKMESDTSKLLMTVDFEKEYQSLIKRRLF